MNYRYFERDHPFLSNWGLSALSILLKTIIGGVPGLTVAIKQETTGIALAAAAEPAILKSIELLAEKLHKKMPELTKKEAKKPSCWQRNWHYTNNRRHCCYKKLYT